MTNFLSSISDSFDVYNIETALPKLDLDTIESHIKAAKDAERRVSKYLKSVLDKSVF